MSISHLIDFLFQRYMRLLSEVIEVALLVTNPLDNVPSVKVDKNNRK